MLLSSLLAGILAGVVATPHCAGMCGAFPLHLSRASQRAAVPVRLLLHLAGKTFTYVFLGAAAGALGSQLVHSGALPASEKVLAYVAGGVILLFGLGMLGVRLPALAGRFNAYDWGVVKSVYSHFFTHPGATSSFLLGVANGFLPCPITLAMLGVAAARHSVLGGMGVMAGLGLGTAPALVLVGACGSLVDARWRRIGLRPAGAIVVVLGLMTILRTQEFMHRGCHHGGSKPACCQGEGGNGGTGK